MQYGEYFSKRPYFVDMLSRALGRPDTEPLSKSPRLRRLIEELRRSVDGTEDYQYFLALENDRVVFRVSSILDDYVQASDSGLVVPQRAILTHFKDQFAGFSTDEIEELEQLLDDPKASEQDFQRFFERHSHFFRKWDYRQVYPQVYLSRGKSPLVPDFILTDRRLQKAAIIDLKLPRPKLVRRQRNRDRFSAAVMEARTQLLRYRDWFRDPSNRQYLKDKLGMEVYEPHLAVVIGRSSEFSDAFERQQLAADNRDIEIVTYDDMLSFAERRRLILKWDVPQKAQGHSLI